MVFDIRGRRRHVVKFVYAILALLMGASLFLVVGPVNIGALLGGSTGTGNPAAGLEEQATRIEHRLRKTPEDPNLLLSLTRARVQAGNTLLVVNPETGATGQTIESRQQYEKASATWSEYLEATKEPTAGAAQLMAPALFALAETSHSLAEAETNLKAAAAAQKIVAEKLPSLHSLSTSAIYTFLTFDYAAGEKAGKEAKVYATTKFEREQLENQLEETSKQAHEFQAQLALAKKAEKGNGAESLKNPLSGLGGGAPLSE
jgi:hypothetical protein